MQSTQKVSPSSTEKTHWFDLVEPETTWLLDGLIPSDGHVLICGKPKCGKSTWIRCLVAAVVKKQRFLGRSVDIPEGTGKVLYIHLDRKDQPWRIKKELMQLGITTREEAERVILRTAEDLPATLKDLPATFEARLEWLKKEVAEANPHLIVIDLLWQFLQIGNTNDYQAVLTGINKLQDALTEAKYKGATIVAMHGRKAVNPDNPADDILGSTAQSGSFVTTIMLSRNRRENIYTITTDQTVRDEVYGEIDECQILKLPDGTLTLGTKVSDLKVAEAKAKEKSDIHRLLVFIHSNPGCETKQIIPGLSISKTRAVELIAKSSKLIRIEGEGVKGDPHKHYVDALPPAMELDAMFGMKGGSNVVN